MSQSRYVHVVWLLGMAVLWTTPARAQVPSTPEVKEEHTAVSLRSALLYDDASGLSVVQLAGNDRRNIVLAFGLSAAVPGLGQAYNRQWVKAAVGIALEAAMWTGYVVWRRQGLDGRDAYWDYAHSHWDPTQYADWLNDYRSYIEQEYGRTVTTPAVDFSMVGGIDFHDPDNWSDEQRRLVDQFFNQIRALEEDPGVVFVETGASFSHKLPYFGEQQYYELIGKYYQYAPGWDDYASWRDGEEGFNERINPELSREGTKVNVSARFHEYARDHARANDLLRQASRVSSLIVINHLLAAFDAAISAKLHNNRIDTDLRLEHDAFGRPQPMATLRVRF